MLIQLAIMGVLVSLLPLTVVWVSSDANKYRKLVWVTVFLTFDLIMFGAFTRLTDSGLGCPDWPGCYGHANPIQAHAHISAAEAAMPDGPVTVMKAWIEMIHRYVAMGIGVLILAMMAVTWRRWLRSRRIDTRLSPVLPTALLGFIALQGAFGAWTVTMRLQPIIVTIHLLLGMLLLALLTWLGAHQDDHPPSLALQGAARAAPPQKSVVFWGPLPTRGLLRRPTLMCRALPDTLLASAALRRPAALALTLLFAQIGLGGWVSTNYAATACADVPFCHGELVPEMDFANGFTLWRKLGQTGDGGHLPFAALTAIHWTHRVVALAVIAWVGWCAYRALGVAALRKTGRGLLLALALQAATGIATVYLNLPLALAVVHNGGAALLVVLLVILNYKARAAAAAHASDATEALVAG